MATIRSWRDAVAGLEADLRAVVAGRLQSLVAYEAHGLLGEATAAAPGDATKDIRHDGRIHTLAVVEELGYADLAALAPLTPAWNKRGLAVPLLLSPEEIRRSLDAFPLEFSQILSRHVLIAGDDLLAGCAVSPDDLRRACEQQVRSHLLHLREGYLQSGGSPRKLAELVAASVTPLRALLIDIARLHGVNARTPDALTHFVEERLHLPKDGLRPLLSERPAEHFRSADAGASFPAYLQAMEQLATLVDEWTR